MSLQDLARETPSQDDLTRYRAYIIAESDRGAAVMAGALVERALEDRIRVYLMDPQEEWFSGINAPFRSFAAKITLGRALGLFTEEIEQRLTIVKNIRNAFAHSMKPLDFDHPTLKDECAKLPPAVRDTKHLKTRMVFAVGCLALANALGMRFDAPDDQAASAEGST